MERSESLASFTQEKVESAVKGFSHRHDAHILVWLVSDLNRTNHGAGHFTCEIEVRAPRNKDHFIQKSGSDMHAAIQEAAEKLKIVLDEAGKKQMRAR